MMELASCARVKVGYLVPELFAAAKGWVIALTPGGVDQDIVFVFG